MSADAVGRPPFLSFVSAPVFGSDETVVALLGLFVRSNRPQEIPDLAATVCRARRTGPRSAWAPPHPRPCGSGRRDRHQRGARSPSRGRHGSHRPRSERMGGRAPGPRRVRTGAGVAPGVGRGDRADDRRPARSPPRDRGVVPPRRRRGVAPREHHRRRGAPAVGDDGGATRPRARPSISLPARVEVRDPVPPPSLATEIDDPRRRRALESAVARPSVDVRHITSVDGPVDDGTLLGLDFHNQELGLPLPDYTTWWRSSDLSTTYAYHERVLQLLQSRRPRARGWSRRHTTTSTSMISPRSTRLLGS